MILKVRHPPEKAPYSRRYAPKDVERQLDILVRYWPHLDIQHALKYLATIRGKALPKGAEALFCVIDPYFFGPSRDVAHWEILHALDQQRRRGRKFTNYCTGRLDGRHLQPTPALLRAEQKLRKQQSGPIWILPAQFGFRLRGRSPEEARGHCKASARKGTAEFALGSLGVGCMLLTHPKRFVHVTGLHAECAGDQFTRHAGGEFDSSPFFYMTKGKLSFDAFQVTMSFANSGAVTGFHF